MKTISPEHTQILLEYINTELSLIDALKSGPLIAVIRGFDAMFTIKCHLDAAVPHPEQAKLDNVFIPLSIDLAVRALVFEIESIRRAQPSLLNHEEIVKRMPLFQKNQPRLITKDMLDASCELLESMQEPNKKANIFNIEQKKVYLDILNAALVNMEVQSSLGTEESKNNIYSIGAKATHQVSKHASALGLKGDDLLKDRDIFIRLECIRTRYAFISPSKKQELDAIYPCVFFAKQKPLSRQEIEQASSTALNKEQIQIINGLRTAFRTYDQKNSSLHESLFKPLDTALKDLSRTHRIDEFRQKADKILNQHQLHTATGVEFSVYNTVVFILRTFFRLLDVFVSTITFREKLMRDTETPFAKRLVGKSNFFTYAPPAVTVAETQNRILFSQLKSELNTSIENFKKADFLNDQDKFALHAHNLKNRVR